MPMDLEKVRKEDRKIRKMNQKSQKVMRNPVNLWKSQSLVDSLYNEKDGERIPRASDIHQSSYDNLKYILE